MDVKRWRQIEKITLEALEFPETERREFLEKICSGDADLFSEVQSFLAQHDENGDFLEREDFERIVGSLVEFEESKIVGKRLGIYRILREIGAGGMGAVFLAERDDGEFEQQVAVKIVRRTIIEKELINRFRRERQILAGLNHPFIAKLLDGGVSKTGEPFLVMEFVEGIPLLEFSENLDLEARLRLFLKICSAVSYAHRNLIVHRDIKPSNVLVTADGEPKLLDFGLAKILDAGLTDENQTQTAFRALTPAYASPEQMRGESVTTASDIYSLGVVLYELLTGNRPFDLKTNSFEEMLRVISTGQPIRPSSISSSRTFQTNERGTKSKGQGTKSLRGDIDNIVLMAIRKEPERRYATVEEFAADIQRNLSGLPVIARSNTFAYRASKFILRNKIAAAAAALILLTIFGGLFATNRQSRIAQQERDKANIEKTKAESVSGFLSRMLNYSDPNSGLQREMTVKEILDRAAAQLDSGSLSNQPETDAELHKIIGYSYIAQELNEPAEKHFRATLAKQIELYGADSLETVKTKALLASVILNQGRNAESEQIYREILPRLRLEYQNGNIEADYPADVLHQYAVLRRAQGDSREAEELLREGLILLPYLSPNDPNIATSNGRNLATVIRNTLALTLFDQGKLDEAIAMARENIGEMRRTKPANDLDFGYPLTGFGNYLTEKGEYAEAEAVLFEAEAIYRNLLGNSHLFLGDNLRIQANMFYQQGKFGQAQSKIAETLRIYRANTSSQYINYPTALTIEALILNKTGKPQEAEKILREAVNIRTENLPEGSYLTALATSALGECLTTQNRFDEAEPLLLNSYESLKSSQGERNPRTSIARNRLAVLYEKWNKPETAKAFRSPSNQN